MRVWLRLVMVFPAPLSRLALCEACGLGGGSGSIPLSPDSDLGSDSSQDSNTCFQLKYVAKQIKFETYLRASVWRHFGNFG